MPDTLRRAALLRPLLPWAQVKAEVVPTVVGLRWSRPPSRWLRSVASSGASAVLVGDGCRSPSTRR
jgi:hypothetical protein